VRFNGAFSFLRIVVAAALAFVVPATAAQAEDTIKVALGQRGNWETAASELGQNAGLFKKRGLELELLYTNGSAETLQAVISGSVDIGIGLGTSAMPARAPANTGTSRRIRPSRRWRTPTARPSPIPPRDRRATSSCSR
jgi:ABC-type nitrate/sulfonate/bicarbonate transport system substrate-binding protein